VSAGGGVCNNRGRGGGRGGGRSSGVIGIEELVVAAADVASLVLRSRGFSVRAAEVEVEVVIEVLIEVVVEVAPLAENFSKSPVEAE
jgi:hypothetical protein